VHIQTSPGWLITNCTIADNFAEEYPGGFYTATFSYPSLLNCIVYNNLSPTYPAIFVGGDDSLSVSYSDIEGGWEGEGNIEADPLFAYTVPNPYQITWTNWPIADSTHSPCIDAGNPEPFYFDPDSTRNDIGACYFDQRLTPISDLRITIVGADVILNWSPVLGAVSYKIYASDSPYTLGDLIAEIPGSNLSYTLLGTVSSCFEFYNVIGSN
jgi:hypothetical protein